MEVLTSLLGRNGFLPHGYCFTWAPGLLWSMVAADLVIAAAYFSIPMTLTSFVRQRQEVTHRGIVWLFSAFIAACGVTHVLDVWTIWQPDYGLLMLAKVATAAVSLLTAVVLWRLIPRALALPTVAGQAEVIRELEAEVARRRTAEEHLNESEQGLALTLASIGAGFIATDRQGQVTRMNAVAERVLGWPQAEALGHSIWEVFRREGRPPEYERLNPIDLLIQRGITIEQPQDVVALSRSGSRTHLELKAALTHDSDGSVRGIAMVFRDMTQQMLQEAATQRLAAIVESSNDAVISKTLDGRITSWNRAAQALFGYSAEEAIGQRVHMLIPTERLDEEMRILAELASGRKVPAFDTQRLTKDGRLVDVSVSISPLRDGSGTIVGASKIATDITQRRLALDARQDALRLEAENRQIQEASRLKSQFLANMSHELRTPLNAIIGFADLMHAGAVPADSPKHHEFLGHIGSSGRHLLQLINDVLDLSKVESGKFEFYPEPVALQALVQEVLAVQHTAVQRKKLQVQTEIDAELIGLDLDPARLKQVLFNYLSNAIKFTPEGGRIVVRALPEGPKRFRLEVEDTGIGIAEADIGRLFNEFQQLDAGYSKQHQGTGLGLALTRRLVQAQGGTVGVRSQPGQGSVFHLVLDRVVRVPAPGQPAADAEPRHLLVIEDDDRLQQQLRSGLAESAILVHKATSASMAVQHASSQTFHAIMLDLKLPDEAGLGVLDHIRRAGPSREAPVLGLSMPGHEGPPATFPVADVLAKPIRIDQVVQAMARLRRADQAPLRVMVVDDDPVARELMETSLTALGMVSMGASGGRQALLDLALHRPDVIVLDLMMPGFDGFETLDALRQMPAWRHTPVLIWTSMLLTADEVATLARSASAILRKGGGTLEPLLEALRRWQSATETPQ